MIGFRTNQKNVMEYFETVIEKWRGRLHDPVMATRCGSKVAGFGNTHSDEDITLLCNDIDDNEIWNIDRYTSPAQGDLLEVNRKRLMKLLEEMLNKNAEKTYPTNFYRTRDEERSYRADDHPFTVLSKDYGHLEDKLFYTLCHDILRTDVIYINKMHPEFNYTSLCRQVRTIDFLDTYYVRAFGNWKYNLDGEKEVLCRKYLYTLDRTLAIWWIVKNQSKPPLYFPALCEGLPIDEEFNEHIKKCIESNAKATSGKATYTIPSDDWLNGRIKDLLDELCPHVHEYDKNETYDELMQNTPEDLQPIVTEFDMG